MSNFNDNPETAANKSSSSFFGQWGPGTYVIVATLFLAAVLPYFDKSAKNETNEDAKSVLLAQAEPTPLIEATSEPTPEPTLLVALAAAEPTAAPELLISTVNATNPSIQPANILGQRAPAFFTFSRVSFSRYRGGRQLSDVDLKPEISPEIGGNWFWENNQRLRFEPAQDWRPGEAYTVTFPEDFLGENVRLSNPQITITAPTFTATWVETNFHDNQEDASQRHLSAKVHFTYPVTLPAIQSALKISTLPEANIFSSTKENFSYTLSENGKELTVTTTSVSLPKDETFVVFEFTDSLKEDVFSTSLSTNSTGRVLVPTAFSLFQIAAANLIIVESTDPLAAPSQALTIETSVNASGNVLSEFVELFVLPRDRISENNVVEPEFDWKNVAEVTAETLASAEKLPLSLIPTGLEKNQAHTFKYSHTKPGALFLRIKRGAPSYGGYLLANDFQNVFKNPQPDPAVNILPDGGLLTLSGERTITISARGTGTIGLEVARILPDQIQHLVTQSGGRFQDPVFQSSNFTSENITTILGTQISLPGAVDNFAPQSLDISLDDLFATLAEEEKNAEKIAQENTNQRTEVQRRFIPVRGARTALSRTIDKTTSSLSVTAREVAKGMFFFRVFDATPNKNNLKPELENTSANWWEENEERNFIWLYDEEQESWQRVRRPAVASRFLLITDLGIIAKENADGSREVFVQSLSTGEPVRNAQVSILGKNGTILLTSNTNQLGHVHFTDAESYARDREPVSYIVSKGSDTAFLPYSSWDRRLDFSRFDVDGAFIDPQLNLDAFVFCERGIFRPGEEVRFGIAVRRLDWAGDIDGIPLRIRVANTTNDVLYEGTLTCSQSGLSEVSFPTQTTSRSGPYRITVSVPRSEKESTPIGSATFLLQEFQPDTLRVKTEILPEIKTGLRLVNDTTIYVTLENLYGGYPEGRRVIARYNVLPTTLKIPEYPGYIFGDGITSQAPKFNSWDFKDLAESITNADGKTTFALTDIPPQAGGIAAIRIEIEGYEADGGRSVPATANFIATEREKILGVLPPTNHMFMERNQDASIALRAITPSFTPTSYDGLTYHLVEERNFFTLKRRGGSYFYDQVQRDIPLEKTTLNLSEEPLIHTLKTDVPGRFRITITDQDGTELTKFHYHVSGWSDAESQTAMKNSELQIMLDKESYEPGEEVRISLQSSFPGPGLITLESDSVLHHHWFKADSTSSIQTLRIPDDITGQVYLNVALSRAPGDTSIRLNPLAYAIKPITIGKNNRKIGINISAPRRSLPGEKITFNVSANEPSHAIIFAVDEGILNITNYATPNPLAHAFRKFALQTGTLQTLDLVLPEASLFRRLAAAGGNGDVQEEDILDLKANPFSRRIAENALYWSGVTEIGPDPIEMAYTPPDSFSGTLRFMAVAVNHKRLSDAPQVETLVRGPIVIEPNVPLFAAPGDKLDLSVTLSRAEDSLPTQTTPVTLSLKTTQHIEITKPLPDSIALSPGQEVVIPFQANIINMLGGAELTFQAGIGSENITSTATVSVRPPTPRITRVNFSRRDEDEFTVEFPEKIHPAFSDVSVSLSPTPLGMATALKKYLEKYPYGCTEQITSAAFCRLLVNESGEPALPTETLQKQISHTINQLASRQSSNGGIGLWYSDNFEGLDYFSPHVAMLCLQARDLGITIPDSFEKPLLDYIRRMSGRQPESLWELRNLAYMLYVRARHGDQVTSHLLNAQDIIQKKYSAFISSDIFTPLIASAHKILHNHQAADSLMDQFRIGINNIPAHTAYSHWGDYYRPLSRDSFYLALTAMHFPERLNQLPGGWLEALIQPVNAKNFNTNSAAFATMALSALSRATSALPPPEMTLTAITPEGELSATLTGSNVLTAKLPSDVEKLRVEITQRTLPSLYVQSTQTGYPMTIPNKQENNGLEVTRTISNNKEPHATNRAIESAKIGDDLYVHITLRSTTADDVQNIAIVDLLPSGFEIPRTDLTSGPSPQPGVDYIELREDRAIFYCTAPRTGRLSDGSPIPPLTITYRVKPTSQGIIQVPPIYAESMYDSSVTSFGMPSQIAVSREL